MANTGQILAQFKRDSQLPAAVEGDPPRRFVEGANYYLKVPAARALFLEGAIEIVEPISSVGLDDPEGELQKWRRELAAKSKAPAPIASTPSSPAEATNG